MAMTVEATEQLPGTVAGPRERPQLPAVAWIRLMRVYHKLQRRAALTSQRSGLSISRFDVLNHAGVRDGRTQQELAAALFVTKGNICQLIDGMEADGLLERRRDGRSNRIYLTDAGRALRRRILTDQEAELAARFQALSSSEQETLLRLLAKLDRSLD
jgi:DNA-binding MarR family transcriptional regulator